MLIFSLFLYLPQTYNAAAMAVKSISCRSSHGVLDAGCWVLNA